MAGNAKNRKPVLILPFLCVKNASNVVDRNKEGGAVDTFVDVSIDLGVPHWPAIKKKARDKKK